MKVSISCDPLIFTFLDLIKKYEIDKKHGLELDVYQVVSPNLQREIIKMDAIPCHYTRTFYAVKSIIDEERDLTILDAVEDITPGLLLRKDLILDKDEKYKISGCEEAIVPILIYMKNNNYNVEYKFLPIASFKEFLEKKILHGIAISKSFALTASLRELGHRFIIEPEDVAKELEITLTTFIVSKRNLAPNLVEKFRKIKATIIDVWKNDREKIVNYFLIDRDMTKEVANYLYENVKFYEKPLDEKFLKSFENYLEMLKDYNFINRNVKDVDFEKVFYLK